jgi:hypothetical protein
VKTSAIWAALSRPPGPQRPEARGLLEIFARRPVVTGVALTKTEHGQQPRIAHVAVVGVVQRAAGLLEILAGERREAGAHEADLQPLPIALEAREVAVAGVAQGEGRRLERRRGFERHGLSNRGGQIGGQLPVGRREIDAEAVLKHLRRHAGDGVIHQIPEGLALRGRPAIEGPAQEKRTLGDPEFAARVVGGRRGRRQSGEEFRERQRRRRGLRIAPQRIGRRLGNPDHRAQAERMGVIVRVLVEREHAGDKPPRQRRRAVEQQVIHVVARQHQAVAVVAAGAHDGEDGHRVLVPEPEVRQKSDPPRRGQRARRSAAPEAATPKIRQIEQRGVLRRALQHRGDHFPGGRGLQGFVVENHGLRHREGELQPRGQQQLEQAVQAEMREREFPGRAVVTARENFEAGHLRVAPRRPLAHFLDDEGRQVDRAGLLGLSARRRRERARDNEGENREKTWHGGAAGKLPRPDERNKAEMRGPAHDASPLRAPPPVRGGPAG